MSSASDYQKDFERLMAQPEEKADRLEDKARYEATKAEQLKEQALDVAAKQSWNALWQRAKSVGMNLADIVRYAVEGGVLTEIEERERRKDE